MSSYKGKKPFNKNKSPQRPATLKTGKKSESENSNVIKSRHESPNVKDTRQTQITKNEPTQEPEYVNKHRKREIVSNWSRYEIIDDTEEFNQLTDFNELLEASKNESKYLNDEKAKSQQKILRFDYESDSKSDNLFSIDVFKLNNVFKCIPFNEYFLNGLMKLNEANYLTDDLLKQFEFDSKQSLNEYNRIYKTQINSYEQNVDSKLINKHFDDIEQLKQLNINEEKHVPKVINKEETLKDQVNENLTIDDWLDDVILD